MTNKGSAFFLVVDDAFPVSPIPEQFFWKDGDDPLDRDIPQELQNRIATRPWHDVTLDDWALIGTPPSIARFYMEPAAFIYYLPSLLIGSLERIDRIDFALEAIIPFNKERRPRGKWWTDFSGRISSAQRKVLSDFLLRIRTELWRDISLADRELVQKADDIWLHARSPEQSAPAIRFPQ